MGTFGAEGRLETIETNPNNIDIQVLTDLMATTMRQLKFHLTHYKYVQTDEQGIPIIAGTTMKVVELVTAHLTHSWSPEELHQQYPHLSMSQIHSALAYYWDHQAEMDADREQRF